MNEVYEGSLALDSNALISVEVRKTELGFIIKFKDGKHEGSINLHRQSGNFFSGTGDIRNKHWFGGPITVKITHVNGLINLEGIWSMEDGTHSVTITTGVKI